MNLRALALNKITHSILQLMALQFNWRPALRRYLKGKDGWIDFSVGFKTECGAVSQSIDFRQGKVRVFGDRARTVDVTLRFADRQALLDLIRLPPHKAFGLVLRNRMVMEGNIAYLQLFNYLVSLLMKGWHRQFERVSRPTVTPSCRTKKSENRHDRKRPGITNCSHDRGVRFIDDPSLSSFQLKDFPRLDTFLEKHFSHRPEICVERPVLLTDWYRKKGFEKDRQGKRWNPALRQAQAFRHLLENKRPIIRRGDLLAGTTTTKEIGVVVYPDAQGTTIWGELGTISERQLNPFDISDDAIESLHHDVFPFWAKRTFSQWADEKYNSPMCGDIARRLCAYFVWKSIGISHTIPDFGSLLNKGLLGIQGEIQAAIEVYENSENSDSSRKLQLEAMSDCLEGVMTYARHLSEEASRLARSEADPQRRTELERLAAICAKVPAKPSETLDEAINAIWIVWVALHQENSNTGLSLGRLDQLLQPFFLRDMEKLRSEEQRKEHIRRAIELVGCFFLRCTDHVPLTPDIGNYLFSGSASDQAITLGGVTAEGDDGVNDMTYIFLKVTEMLALRDPNINARYHAEKNSETYVKRLCEVNLVTGATPSMHNDHAVFSALAKHKYSEKDIRDWCATGCVEPTIQGKHMGHTGSILMNLVAALEMALNDGRHPLMRWDLGPRTGNIEKREFSSFEQFYRAFEEQLDFLVDHAADLNRMLGEAHAEIRPTPLLSGLMKGPVESGKDVTSGGALYNTSGTSNIGLADVTDSLLAVKKLVFDEKKVSFKTLKDALDSNFSGHSSVLALITKSVPRFGSGNEEAMEMARRVMRTVGQAYDRHRNSRGGRYTCGFWSISQHVAYGNLSGALPSGRLAGKAFSPGLTPHPIASETFLDNIHDVARLDPTEMDNNIAFNVKLVPGLNHQHDQSVDHMKAYVQTYAQLGGMQMQFNVVSSETLRDAMAHPEDYQKLLVRISGYNAYFVTLSKELQLELIERAEYGMA